jgi:DNA-directed RNA polymerase subunit RPC12/RpoP
VCKVCGKEVPYVRTVKGHGTGVCSKTCRNRLFMKVRKAPIRTISVKR